jgi:hypothetical protein
MMSDFQALHVREDGSSAVFTLHKRIELPIAVQFAAWLVPTADDLYIWINAGGSETNQLRLNETRELEMLPKLNIVGGGVAACRREFILTGTDLYGKPVVLGVNGDGTEQWRTTVTGAKPTAFPVPYCIGQPLIVWQTEPLKMHIAQMQSGALEHLHTVDIGMPPVRTTALDNTLYVVWANKGGIDGLAIDTGSIKPFHTTMPYPATLAIGTAHENLYVAWKQRDANFIAALTDDRTGIHEPIEIDMKKSRGGKFHLVSGQQPLIWIQHLDNENAADGRWSSALAIPQHPPLYIDGQIYRIAWWNDLLVVLGSVDMLVFKVSTP